LDSFNNLRLDRDALSSLTARGDGTPPSLGIELSPVDVRDAHEIGRAVTAFFARSGNGGLIATASGVATRHRDLIITLAARYGLPAVYSGRWFVTDGGLLCYWPDYVDQFRQAAGYVDRILRGEKPADLPANRRDLRDFYCASRTALREFNRPIAARFRKALRRRETPRREFT
jgi:ABC-type uncharacterized transport system substrate-binding protein